MYAMTKKELSQLIRCLRGCKGVHVLGNRKGHDIELRVIRVDGTSSFVDEFEFQGIVMDDE